MRAVPRRIHVLGIGNIGKLVAHSLREIPNAPPITLLLRRREMLDRWSKEGEAIKVTINGVTKESRGFDVELSYQESLKGSNKISQPSTIHNLIITSKAYDAVGIVGSLKHRLTRDSTILFLYNGIGFIDEVNKIVFPDIKTRPTYIIGITSHGVSSPGLTSFSAVHRGIGTTALGILPRESSATIQGGRRPTYGGELSQSPSAHYLLRTLTRAPTLNATGYPASMLHVLQLEKLVVNCIINPLTAIFDCKNGELLHNHPLSRIIDLVLQESTSVVGSLPELENLSSSTLTRLSLSRLKKLALRVLASTADNTSSMLSDVRQGRRTEIDYINGYIRRRGQDLGIKCPTNDMLVDMVNGRSLMTAQQLRKHVPFDNVRDQERI